MASYAFAFFRFVTVVYGCGVHTMAAGFRENASDFGH
jgi:hypothetical protein